ncbi:MAG TPA: response regulator [Syntrophorhabdales bacterium]|nr:response regulator [Syntrophorhabdales bacterium]
MKKRILFVDDEPRVLQGLQRMLRDRNDSWDLVFVSSAAEAQKLLDQEDFDVAVLDVRMPEKDGLDLLVEMKSEGRTRDIEVIMLTGLEDGKLKYEAVDCGAIDLLRKPVAREELLARLHSALRIKAYRDELKETNSMLEQQLVQSQKMEAVGLLAAGVVHDLNNILTAIGGYSNRVARAASDDPAMVRIRDLVERIGSASDRAIKIVQQILKFTKQNGTPDEPCHLGALVKECIDMVIDFIPSAITLEFEDRCTSSWIRANSSEMYQVLLNLCINGIEAMGDKGVLRISLSETQLDLFASDSVDLAGGTYIRLEVSDTGQGMDEATSKRVFEPSFTNKKAHGTGLGLAVVARIVKNHKGSMSVKSSSGQGSTFSVYLPSGGNCSTEPSKELVEEATKATIVQ